MVFQTDYTYHIGRAYKGAVARPGEPTKVDYGIAGEDLEPGDAVIFDYTNTELNFVKPAAGTLAQVMGIVLYNEGMVPNASGNVVIASGKPVRVGVEGAFYAEAGTRIEYGQQCAWNVADGVWDHLSTIPTDYTDAHYNPAFCGDRVVADGELFALNFEGRIR